MSAILKNYSTKIVAALIILAMVLTAVGISTTTVDAAAKAPTKITLKSTYDKVDINGKVTVSVKSVTPEKASKAVTWKSSNSKVATVNAKGVVTGKKWGSVTITATSKVDKKVKATIKIKVRNLKPTGVTVKKANVTLARPGVTWQLNPTVKPSNVYKTGITYSSNNKTVATVDSKGKITAKAPGKATITIKTENGKTTAVKITVSGKKVLSPWVLTGYAKTTKINNCDVDSDATLQVWNPSKKAWVKTEKTNSAIRGNYTQLYDLDGDKSADLIQMVKYADGAKYWNANTPWINGVAGKDTNPYQPINDSTGWDMYDVDYRIPMGERQLANWGLKDWSGTTDWAAYEESPYWENTDADFYNLTSSDTLTMLTGFRTSLQETGSTCVMNSALTVLDWYGVRGDLNAKDLSSLRSEKRGTTGGTSLDELETVFNQLYKLGITDRWNMEGWNDNEGLLYDSPEWLKAQLEAGHPVIVIWNSYGAHGQVIIGYDDMGTPESNDDVLIMMDPYDTTDHNPDGYIIQSYERLVWGKLTWGADTTFTKFLAVWPDEWDYEPVMGKGLRLDKTNAGNVDNGASADWDAGKLILSEDFAEIDGMKIPYDTTAADLQAYYDAADITGVYPYLDTNLSGAAGVERSGDVAYSPYYQLDDFYGTEEEVQAAVGSETLDIIDNFSTIQQSTEFSCGVTSAYMAMYNYGMIPEDEDGKLLESDASLSKIRQVDPETGLGEAGATYVEGLDEVFQYMTNTYYQSWAVASDQDYVEDEDGYLVLGEKYQDNELIPYLIANDVPMLIGWDEWGGHWQAVIGYDDMGTDATQDDVVILADAYDTTDHNQNGYVIESFERLLYGWNSEFETWNDEATGYEDDMYNAMYIAVPNIPEYADVIATLGLKVIEPDYKVVEKWALNGYYSTEKLNNKAIEDDTTVLVWDKATGGYAEAKLSEENILGNYIQLCDADGDKVADIVMVVKFEDGAAKWDANMVWLDGVAENNRYQPIDDETGWATFDKEYRIPMGERQLANWGLGDYSGTTDWAKQEEMTYWPGYDYYNVKSDDTLTILSGYKTSLQETGSTCVLNSALSVLDWYGVRADLNAKDLAAIRSADRGTTGGTSLRELITVFEKLEELGITGEWNLTSSFDETGDFAGDGYTMLADSEWLQGELAAGHPVMIIWNSYGGHGQVIIGYDNMGTESVSDDVLLLMDPYDTTDHNPDGYTLQSYERLIYGLGNLNAEKAEADKLSEVRYLVAYPEGDWAGWTNDAAGTIEIKDNPDNKISYKDENKLNADAEYLAQLQADLEAYYPDYMDPEHPWMYYVETAGVGGPLAYDLEGWEADYDNSPYYNHYDYYNGEGGTDNLMIIENYKTIQQSSEWACGCTSAAMVLEHFDPEGTYTDMGLSAIRQIPEGEEVGEVGGTYLSGMKEIFDAQNTDPENPEWTYFTRFSLDDPDSDEAYIGDYCVQAGTDPDWYGLFPYLIEKGIPIMIGWDEWGGHWQTIIGYDDLGTPVDTQDDVLILADSYDTTDHAIDGYVVESFERLVYGWNTQFEEWGDQGFNNNDFIVAFPTEGYEDVIEELGLEPGANN